VSNAWNVQGGAPQSPSSGLLSLLGGGGRLGTIIQAVGLAVDLYTRSRAAYDRWQQERTYALQVSSHDDLYPEIHRWLLARMPERDRRSLTATTSDRSHLGQSVGPSGEDQPPASVRYLYDGAATVRIALQGQPIDVSISRDERPSPGKWAKPDDHIVFTAHSVEGQRAVMGTIEQLAREQTTSGDPWLYVAAPWGGWNRTARIGMRDPSTVVLAPGLMERLSADLATFLESEARYARIGAPWHRGYLLHGPSGTGKSSTVQAIASAHRLDVYYLPLGDLDSNTNLAQLVAGIKGRSVLLIEDIDISRAATTRDDQPERVSLQGLLNSLDGALTPHGLIVFATTNDRSMLEAALTREGRFDLHAEIGYLTDEQLARLVEVMTGRAAPLPSIGDRQLAAASITELVKRNITDMDAARAAIVEYLRDEGGAREAAA
jgi:hypothetical protein